MAGLLIIVVGSVVNASFFESVPLTTTTVAATTKTSSKITASSHAYDESRLLQEVRKPPTASLFVPEASRREALASCRATGRKYVFAKDEVVPIIFISHERAEALLYAIHSVQRLVVDPYKIYVVDFGSVQPAVVETLKELEKEGIVVARRPHKGMDWSFREISKFVQTLEDNFSFYVVSDPDVALASAGDILQYYASLLINCPALVKIGPGLSVGDVPPFYPLQAEVHLCHDVFWTPKKMAAISWKSVLTHVFFFPIDTTWHMHRRKTGWTRGLGEASIRTGPPYASRHADWYLNPSVMSADMQAYSTAKKSGSHWGRFFDPDIKASLQSSCKTRFRRSAL